MPSVKMRPHNMRILGVEKSLKLNQPVWPLTVAHARRDRESLGAERRVLRRQIKHRNRRRRRHVFRCLRYRRVYAFAAPKEDILRKYGKILSACRLPTFCSRGFTW